MNKKTKKKKKKKKIQLDREVMLAFALDHTTCVFVFEGV